jgi:hypothetical protein
LRKKPPARDVDAEVRMKKVQEIGDSALEEC